MTHLLSKIEKKLFGKTRKLTVFNNLEKPVTITFSGKDVTRTLQGNAKLGGSIKPLGVGVDFGANLTAGMSTTQSESFLVTVEAGQTLPVLDVEDKLTADQCVIDEKEFEIKREALIPTDIIFEKDDDEKDPKIHGKCIFKKAGKHDNYCVVVLEEKEDIATAGGDVQNVHAPNNKGFISKHQRGAITINNNEK